MYAVLCFTRFSLNAEDNHVEFQSSQLSLISSELYSYSLTDHSLTPLILHNLTQISLIQQQSMSVEIILVQEV